MRVDQLLPNFVLGDATGTAAIGFRQVLRRLGHHGEVYAQQVAPRFQSLVKPASALKWHDGLVLYHHGIASELASSLLHWPGRKGVVFHNITPERFYRGTTLAYSLRAGRAQLAALAEAVDVSIGVSNYNASELRIAGHRNVHTVPLFIEPERFDPDRADPLMAQRLAGGRPLVLSVGRVVPHKRIEDLLSLHAELLKLAPDARLCVVGAMAAGESAARALLRRAHGLPGVSFLGRLGHAELVAAYRACDVYVSMSEHEGFGVPLVEAMACDVPVLAFGAAAVPETLGERGIVFDEKNFAALAELIAHLYAHPNVAQHIAEGQRSRVKELSDENTALAMAQALSSLEAQAAHVTAGRSRRQRASDQRRVAVVVQRYGSEVTGGAEAHARQVAHRLADHAQVTVLTSCSTNHLKWDNALAPGESLDGQVRVLRFRSERERQLRAFNRLSQSVFGVGNDLPTEEHWLAEQGPLLPELWAHLGEAGDAYHAVIFFTYLYAPTVWGLPLVANKALLVPTAHDEPALQLEVLADVFCAPQALLCNTDEEAQLIRQRFPQAARSRIVGVGVEVPATVRAERFRHRFSIEGPYLFYVGRLEAGKGVDALLKLHAKLKRPMTLVLAGSGEMRPQGEKVLCLGRISEEEKFDGLSGAVAAVIPSRYESLSLLALEAFSVGCPILANGASAVLAGHVRRSQAGATWHDADGFRQAVSRIERQRAELGERALKYARAYRWPKVVEAYLEEIDAIRSRGTANLAARWQTYGERA